MPISALGWDDWSWVYHDELHVSSFLQQVATLCLDSIVSPLQLHWVKGVWIIRCNLPPALLAEWPGSFKCHCSSTEVGQTLNKSLHTKRTLRRKNLLLLLPGLELATWVRLTLYQKAIPAPLRTMYVCVYLPWCRGEQLLILRRQLRKLPLLSFDFTYLHISFYPDPRLQSEARVVPKGLLTFLGSLYKEVTKTSSGTLMYRFERQTARKKILPSKNTVSSTQNVGFYLKNVQIAAFCILLS